MRGDTLYCPLPLSLDAYGNCLTNCHNCWIRHLNHIWDKELKPADITLLRKKLDNGLKNKNPKTPLAHALKQKKTIRLGNKTDPFQEIETKYRISRKILSILIRRNWTFVIQTKFTHVMMEYEIALELASTKKLITVMPVMSPGLEKDWEVFEKSLTTPPLDRIKHAVQLQNKGIPVGFNGEPFMPGYHTVKDFENALKLLKSNNIKSYNTYNFHFNPYVAKRLNAIGIDIEKIWYYNQDKEWKKILPKLLDLSRQYGILLGNPDFVNTGKDWIEPANTCCGINVPNPCTFNTHYFKKYRQFGKTKKQVILLTNDGTGNYEQGVSIVMGTCKYMYNLNDVGL